MAVITSAQGGDWSAVATWVGGVLPTNGDDVNINHAVVYDLDNLVNIFGTITINGVTASLTHKSGQWTRIKVWRTHMNTGGTYEMTPMSEHVIQARTNDINGGRVYMYNSNFCKFIANGSYPNVHEPIVSNNTHNYFVTLGTGKGSLFGIGDYVAIYKEGAKTKLDCTDEGFIVSNVSGDNIYLCKRVGPKSLITNSFLNQGTNKVVVEDARLFRVGMYVTSYGGILTNQITSIDLATNTIFLNNIHSGDYAGMYLVECGKDKSHDNGDILYKLCTTLSEDVNASQSIINVVNKGNWVVGDTIIIEGTDSSWTSDNCIAEKFVINSINGNQLTLSGDLAYKHELGAIVTKLNRDCIIRGDYDENGSTWGAHIHVESADTNNRRVVDLNWVWADRLYNSYTTTYRGFFVRGYFNGTGGMCNLNGVSVSEGADGTYGGLTLYDAVYGIAPVRNCVAYRTYSGICLQADYDSGAIYNCIGMYNYYSNIRIMNKVDRGNIAYNISCNSDEWGYMFENSYRGRLETTNLGSDRYNMSQVVEFNISRHDRDSIYSGVYNKALENGNTKRFSIQKSYYEPYQIDGVEDVYLFESELVGPFKYIGFDRGSGYQDVKYSNARGAYIVFPNVNWIEGDHVMYSYRIKIETDYTLRVGSENSLKINGASRGFDKGLAERVYVQAGDTVDVQVLFRIDSAYDGINYPKIRVQGNLYMVPVETVMPNVSDQWVPVRYTYTSSKSEFLYIYLLADNGVGNWWIARPQIRINGKRENNYFMGSVSGKFATSIGRGSTGGVTFGGVRW